MMRKAALAVAETMNPQNIIHPHDVFIREDFVDTSAVVAAVSGGGDSIALLLLLRKCLAEMDNPPRLITVTVDHGLRQNSAQEARQVAAFCEKHAITHKIVCWQGEKPQTGLMARARLARYQLLAEQARLYGAQVIFTGHNFDDRAETYLMRAARAQATKAQPKMTRGLAAMARQSWLLGDIRLIRPLLETRRSALRQFLQAHHVGWIDDPSNEDRRFERVRLRHTLCEQDILVAARAAHRATKQRHCYNIRAIEFIKQSRLQSSNEVYQLDLTDLPINDNFLPQFIADLAALVGGAQYLRPAGPQLRCLLAQFSDQVCSGFRIKNCGEKQTVETQISDSIKSHSALSNNNRQRLTLTGAVIEKQGAKLTLWRERRNLHPLTIAAGCQAIWDRRFQISNKGDEDILIRAIERDELKSYPFTSNVTAMRLQAAPVIVGSKGVDMPTLNGALIHSRHVCLKRILPPFEFLVADGDAAFVAHLKQIFTFPQIYSERDAENRQS